MGKVEPSGSGERGNPLLLSSSSFGVMVVVFGQDSNRRECVQEFLCHILLCSPTIESIDKVDQIDRPLVVGWFSDPTDRVLTWNHSWSFRTIDDCNDCLVVEIVIVSVVVVDLGPKPTQPTWTTST